MNKIGIFGGILAVIAVVGLVYLNYVESPSMLATKTDYKNATYTIDGEDVTLVEGLSETPAAPGSASMLSIKYFGNVAKGDLNADGIPDLAFLLTQSSGGSGTFFYLVAALQNSAGGYTGTNAVLLGDRIAPQETEIKDGEIVVNYADRKVGQPMSAVPSVGVSKYLKVENNHLVTDSMKLGTE